MKIFKWIPLIIIMVSFYGCAGRDDLRVRPDYAPERAYRVAEPIPPIKDKNLYAMYKHVKKFDAVLWEDREAELFNMIGNRLSIGTVNYYNHLLDIDQEQAVSEFLGPIGNQVLSGCNWFKPPDRNIRYIRGGSCDGGKLNDNAEFVLHQNNIYYSYWVAMKDGEAIKGILGQNRVIRAVPSNKMGKNPFHNWNGKNDPNQVEALTVGYLNKNFQGSGVRSVQGFNTARFIGEFKDGVGNGWMAKFLIISDDLSNGKKYKGMKLSYLGQYKDNEWNGIGVMVHSGKEIYLTSKGHWVPMKITYSLGWKLYNKSFESNGPSIYYNMYDFGTDNFRSIMYYGYRINGSLRGVGVKEDRYITYGGGRHRRIWLGNYNNGTRVGKHQGYTQRGRDRDYDYCYNSGEWVNCNPGQGDGFGKFFALAAGAALAGSSNLSSTQQMEFMTAYSVDVLTDSGGTNMQNLGNQQTQQLQQTHSSSQQGGVKNSSQPQMKEASYTFTCRDTQKQHSLKVPYYTSTCLSAAKNFAKVNGCNMVNEMASASKQCSSACGDQQCLESPSDGRSGSGDNELDFLNSRGI